MAAGAPGAAVITGGGRLPATHCQTSSGTWVVGVGRGLVSTFLSAPFQVGTKAETSKSGLHYLEPVPTPSSPQTCPSFCVLSPVNGFPTHPATHETKECGWLGSCMGHPSPQSCNYPSSLCLSAPRAGGRLCLGPHLGHQAQAGLCGRAPPILSHPHPHSCQPQAVVKSD